MEEATGVSCWICLEEWVDEFCKPLRRDCSCRAASGFAHVSCLVKYAKSKPELEAWTECPSCKQSYQRKLALGLANELLEFIDKEHSTNPQKDVMTMSALHAKIAVITTMDPSKNVQLRADGKKMANKVLSLGNKMLKSGNMKEAWP